MPQIQNSKQYNLEGRCLIFAQNIKNFIKNIYKNLSNIEYSKQIIRSSSSIGANYIEANESLSKKDFIMRVKISRKEAKETIYWLELLDANKEQEVEQIKLKQEATELMKIFGAILEKCK